MPVAWPSAMPWGGRPTVASPARDHRQDLAGALRHPVDRHRGGIRTGSGPVVTRSAAPPGPRGALDRPHGSVGRGAAHVPASAPLGGSRDAMSGPSALRSGAIGSPTRPCAAHVADGSARGQHVIASSRPTATDSGTPGTPPRHPRSVPARPLRARTLCRAYDRQVFGFRVLGSGLDFGIENWPGAHRSGEPGAGGSGQGPPAISLLRRISVTRGAPGSWESGDRTLRFRFREG